MLEMVTGYKMLSSSTPAQNLRRDLLLNCLLISPLDVKSMKISSSAVEGPFEVF
ncbi:hypothetical protein X975_21611, partial [Stegodyphus mimosarum]